MFNIHYDKITGVIQSYQEGEGRDPTPEGMATSSFPYVPAEFVNYNGSTQFKIDPATGRLIKLSPEKIPEPLPNPPNAAPFQVF